MKAKFFGYEVEPGRYGLDAERKQEMMAFPMPANQKAMQRFLGSALFFKNFIPNFSALTALLNDMAHQNFNWDPKTWTKDYVRAFEETKLAMVNSTTCYFPDYELDWVMRVDASEVAVGSVLFQKRPTADGNDYSHEVIGFASKKFSEQAYRWDMFKKEAYVIFFGVNHFSYYLRGKPLVLETDHRNLVWIEKSEAAIVVRWRIFMQQFIIWLRHIPGRQNIVADWMSRMYAYEQGEDEAEEDSSETQEPHAAAVLPTQPGKTPEFYIAQAHGGRMPHAGNRRTWKALNKFFPGHKIPYRLVEDFVSTCPICQKDRIGMTEGIQPLVRHIKPPHQRSRIGVDRLTITPTDKYGNTCAVVIVEHFTKHVGVYPSPDYTALTIATALFQYFCTFGLFEELWSDPGSDIMSEVVSQLNSWFGIRHVVSLVDRHESNGVEGSNKQILRHLKALTHESRMVNKWSDPTVLPLVVFAINDAVNSETGVRPLDAKFGSEDGPYLRLPEDSLPAEITHEWVKALDADLRLVRDVSAKYQQELITERLAQTPAETQNQFQTGDFILRQVNPETYLPTKLSSPFLGPYEVIEQVGNVVHCEHLALRFKKEFHVETVKIFYGNREAAYDLAMIDGDQHLVDRILGWRGDPEKRTTMEIDVLFADGDRVILTWTPDLHSTRQFEEYCESQPLLYPLRFAAAAVPKQMALLRAMPIEAVKPGQDFFLDLRFYSTLWYDKLGLADSMCTRYVVQARYVAWRRVSKGPPRIVVEVDLFQERLRPWHNGYVCLYGTTHTLSDDMVLCDRNFALRYSRILPEDRRQKLLDQYRTPIPGGGKKGSVAACALKSV